MLFGVCLVWVRHEGAHTRYKGAVGGVQWYNQQGTIVHMRRCIDTCMPICGYKGGKITCGQVKKMANAFPAIYTAMLYYVMVCYVAESSGFQNVFFRCGVSSYIRES